MYDYDDIFKNSDPFSSSVSDPFFKYLDDIFCDKSPYIPEGLIEAELFEGTPTHTCSSEEKKKEIEVNVFDVAKYIISQKEKISSPEPLTTMKLQKLLYYCQAWSLAWDNKKLFIEPIEAWINGPVVRSLFNHLQGLYNIDEGDIQKGNPDILNDDQIETINVVLDTYGNKSSQWLINLTHLEDPWKNARAGLKPHNRSNKIITLKSMKEYYSNL